MENIKNLELIDERFEVEFNLIEDFKIMYELVRWCDSYTRIGSPLNFHFVKDFVGYSCYFERYKDLPQYIRKMIVYIRKPKHRLDYEDKKIQEFKDFLIKKYQKKYNINILVSVDKINEGMELSLNPIPSQTDNKNNNGSGTKPSTRGI